MMPTIVAIEARLMNHKRLFGSTINQVSNSATVYDALVYFKILMNRGNGLFAYMSNFYL